MKKLPYTEYIVEENGIDFFFKEKTFKTYKSALKYYQKCLNNYSLFTSVLIITIKKIDRDVYGETTETILNHCINDRIVINHLSIDSLSTLIDVLDTIETPYSKALYRALKHAYNERLPKNNPCELRWFIDNQNKLNNQW